MTALRQQRQSHFPLHLNNTRKNFEDLLSHPRGATEEVFKRVWISSGVPNPPLRSFKFLCLGCVPMIGLWLCGSKKFLFLYFKLSSVLIWQNQSAKYKKFSLWNIKYHIWIFVALNRALFCGVFEIRPKVSIHLWWNMKALLCWQVFWWLHFQYV